MQDSLMNPSKKDEYLGLHQTVGFMDGIIVGVKSRANRTEAVVHYITDNVRINGN